MADVTLTHPVTGATKTVSEEKAKSLQASGWVGTSPPNRRPVGPPEVPDIQRGRDKLAAEGGRKFAEPLSQRKPAPRKPKAAKVEEPSDG